MKRIMYSASIVLVLCMLPAFVQAQGPAVAPKTAAAATAVGHLDEALGGTSSLFFWDNRLWSCNDHGCLTLYAIDTASAALTDSISLDTTVYDMEEVAQDADYLYFGDFGNNQGERTDLRILRLAKTALAGGPIHFDTIRYALPPHENPSDMDCEAFIATDTALYLFTKQWTGQQSQCYRLPKRPGTWTPVPVATLPVDGLVTGASCQPDRRLLALCGYSLVCKPFVYLCYGFDSLDFGGGTQVKVELNNRIGTQTEGIATRDGLHYFLTSEHLNAYGLDEPARLWSLDLTAQLGPYLYPDSTFTPTSPAPQPVTLTVYPNPTTHILHLPSTPVKQVELFALNGQSLMQRDGGGDLDLGALPKGTYLLRVTLRTGDVECVNVIKGE